MFLENADKTEKKINIQGNETKLHQFYDKKISMLPGCMTFHSQQFLAYPPVRTKTWKAIEDAASRLQPRG
jgi:hypothetical protein